LSISLPLTSAKLFDSNIKYAYVDVLVVSRINEWRKIRRCGKGLLFCHKVHGLTVGRARRYASVVTSLMSCKVGLPSISSVM